MANEAQNIKKVLVDRNLCIGAASCVVVAGGVFELDGENKAIIKQNSDVKTSGPAPREAITDGSVTDDALLLAAQSCPTKAIYLYDGEGKQVYP